MWTHIDKKFSTPPPTWRKQRPPPSPLSERKKLSPMKAKDDLFRVVHKVPAGDSPYGKAKHIQRSGRIAEEIEMLQFKLKKIEECIAFGAAKTKLARSQGKKIQITVAQERSRILGNLAWAYLQQNDYEIAEQHYRKALSLEADKNKQCNLAICLMHMNRMTEAKSLLQAVKASAGNKQMDESYGKSFDRAVHMLTELESLSVVERSEKQHKNDNEENQRPFGLPDDRDLNLVDGLNYGGPNPVSNINTSRSMADEHDEVVPLNEQDRTAYCQNLHKNMNRVFGHDKGSSKCMSSGSAATSQFSPHSMFVNNWRKGSYLQNQSGKSGFSGTMKEHWVRSAGIGVSCVQQETYASPSTVKSSSEFPFTQTRRPLWGLADGEQKINRWGNSYVSSDQTKLTDDVVLFTQPRISSSDLAEQRRGKWGEKAFGSSVRKLLFEQAITTENVLQNANGELLVSTNDKSLKESESASTSPTGEDWRRKSLKGFAQLKNEAAVESPSQPKPSYWGNDGFAQTKDDTVGRSWTTSTWQNNDDNTTGLKTFVGDETSEMSYTLHPFIAEPKSTQDCIAAQGKKSWADMVEEEEEEEEESLSDRISRVGLDGWNTGEEHNDENINSNVIYSSACPQTQNISQKLKDSMDFQKGNGTSRSAVVSSQNQTVQHSLCFGQYQRPNMGLNSVPMKDNDFFSRKNFNMKTRSRLQVFQDITPFPDSP